MTRVLVTGATGFLGGALCKMLRQDGYGVVCTGRSPRLCASLEKQGFAVQQADLSNTLARSIFGTLDAVVHAAALSAPVGRLRDFNRANVVATRNIVAHARAAGVSRFVNISSPSVYFALRDQLDVRENSTLPSPFNNYARTKAVAEQIVLSTPEIGPISLRPRGIYGPGETSLLPRLMRAARSHYLPVFRGGQARIDLTYVDDVCRAVVAALNAGPASNGKVYNISGGEVLPIRQIIDMTCQRAGIVPRWRAVPFGPALALARFLEHSAALLPGAVEPRITPYGLALLAYQQSLNIEKAAQQLGWRPRVKFAEGLSLTIANKGAS